MIASSPHELSTKRHVFANAVLVVLSLLLLLTGVIVLGQLTSRGPLPETGLVVNPFLLAAAVAILVMSGSVASLLYALARLRRAWSVAVVLFQVGVAANLIMVVQGASTLVWTPARGEWAGLANFGILLLAVAFPGLVALLAAVAVFCLIATRPQQQQPVARWVRRVAVVLLILFIPAGLVVAIGTGASPAARIQAQQQRIKAGDASVEELADALRSQNHEIRFWAVMKLKEQGPRAKAAVPALAEALHDNQSISWPAANALAAIGPDAAPAIPALVAVIEREQGKGTHTDIGDTPSTFSWLAGDALAKIGPASLPELLRLLVHQDRFVRMTAVNALRDMGPQAKDALPALNDALNDEDELVRRFLQVAIDRIEGRRTVADRDPHVPREPNKENERKLQKPPMTGWTTQASFADDPRNRPPGTICVTFDDGYRWLITESVVGREKRNEGDRTIEAVITDTLRYEHVLGTHEVRIIDPFAAPAKEAIPDSS